MVKIKKDNEKIEQKIEQEMKKQGIEPIKPKGAVKKDDLTKMMDEREQLKKDYKLSQKKNKKELRDRENKFEDAKSDYYELQKKVKELDQEKRISSLQLTSMKRTLKHNTLTPLDPKKQEEAKRQGTPDTKHKQANKKLGGRRDS